MHQKSLEWYCKMILFAEETTQNTLSTPWFQTGILTTSGWRKQAMKIFAFAPNLIAVKIAEMVIYINDIDANTCFNNSDKW